MSVWEKYKNRNCAFVTIKLRKIEDKEGEDTLGISVNAKFLKEAKTSPLVIGGTHYFQNKLSDIMKDMNVDDVINSFNELKKTVEEENAKNK